MKETRFRVWDIDEGCFWYWGITDSYPTCLTKEDVKENIQQYINLRDNHNKKIYEGDIIERVCDETGKVLEIIVVKIPDVYFEKWVCFGEIIGNIFENKDLLNEK